MIVDDRYALIGSANISIFMKYFLAVGVNVHRSINIRASSCVVLTYVRFLMLVTNNEIVCILVHCIYTCKWKVTSLIHYKMTEVFAEIVIPKWQCLSKIRTWCARRWTAVNIMRENWRTIWGNHQIPSEHARVNTHSLEICTSLIIHTWLFTCTTQRYLKSKL